MHYLKKEFDRLRKYAEGLGIKVVVTKRDDPYASAEWHTDGSQITFFNSHKKGPLKLVLEFYHELAHHLSWVHSGRKVDLKTDQALYKEFEIEDSKILAKKYRKAIWEAERDDSVFQELIHKEVGSKVKLERLFLERDLDVWIYYRYFLTGNYPLTKEIKEQRKKLRKKYNV